MPQLSRDQNKLNLGAARSAKKAKDAAESEEAKKSTGAKKAAAKTVKKSTQEKQPKPSRINLNAEEDDDEEDEDEEDEIIQSSIKSKKEGGSNNTKFLIIGGIAVAVVVILFLLFRPSTPEVPSVDPSTQTSQPSPQDTPTQQTPVQEEVPDDPNFGTQNFLQDTNNVSDSPLTDPENFTKDIYGLTLRVDYTVSRIQEASDFVNYTKYRGTWGGGLELYYLDCEYKGSRYVIQVPFKYYKELDDEGIVPVKMEVLRIQSETDGTYLSVVSYMCLDEKTLQQVLKTQSK